ncbi:MAG: hypothetical protein HY898_34965 [Deltaproteobacteria bacterium]|nr:hypothetical protein [Deltaproteobacteria bacterium]
MRTRLWFAALAIALAACGCGKSKTDPAQPTASNTASATASGAASASASASAASSAAADAPAAGKGWSGDYTAKKAEIEQPEKVKDVTHKRDPGDKSVGPGKLSISVAGNVVTGTASGALGDQVISGTLEGKSLKFSLFPKTQTAPDAMTGTGTGEVGAASITGTLRCTGPDAVAVREATFELKPAK